MPKQPETPQDWDPNTELPVPEDGGPDVGPGTTIDPLFKEPIQQFTVDPYGNTLPETESTRGLGGEPFEEYNLQNPAPGWTAHDIDPNTELPTPDATGYTATMTEGGNVADFGNYSVDFGGGDQTSDDGYLARDALPPDAEQTAMALSDLPRTDPSQAWGDIDQTHADQPYVPDISPDEAIDINTLGPFPGAPRTMGPPSGYDDLARDALPPDAEETAMSLDDVQASTVAADEAQGMSESEAIQDTELGMTSSQAATEAADEARGMSATEAIQDTQLGMTTSQAATEAADEAQGMSATEAIQDTQLGMTSDQAATEAADEAQGMSATEAINDTQAGLTADQAATEAAAEAQGVSADEAIQDAQEGLSTDQTVTEAAAQAEGLSPDDALAEATGGDPGDLSDSPIPGLVDPNDPGWEPVPGGVGEPSPGEYPGLDLVDRGPGGDAPEDDGGGGGDGPTPPPDGGGGDYGDDGGDGGGDGGDGGEYGDGGDGGGDYGGDGGGDYGGDSGDGGGDYGGESGDGGGDYGGGDSGDE